MRQISYVQYESLCESRPTFYDVTQASAFLERSCRSLREPEHDANTSRGSGLVVVVGAQNAQPTERGESRCGFGYNELTLISRASSPRVRDVGVRGACPTEQRRCCSSRRVHSTCHVLCSSNIMTLAPALPSIVCLKKNRRRRSAKVFMRPMEHSYHHTYWCILLTILRAYIRV
jgi:hypothetical protein